MTIFGDLGGLQLEYKCSYTWGVIIALNLQVSQPLNSARPMEKCGCPMACLRSIEVKDSALLP